MQGAARSSVTAAVVLAAGSMIAATPAMSSLPGLHLRPFQLASAESDIVFADPLAALQADELGSNAGLVTQELASNGTLLADEESFLSNVGAAFPDPTGVTAPEQSLALAAPGSTEIPALERLFDANNLLLGTYENLFNSLLGADNFDPTAINQSLLIGGPATTGPEPYIAIRGGDPAPFLSGQVGGLEGVTGNSLAAYDLAMGDFIPADVVALGDAFETFNQALIGDELAFNTNLLTNEVNAEVAAFGSNNALNGTVDRLINIDNLPLSTAENGFNSVIGATDPNISPADLTASLLTGVGGSPTDPTNVFDTGDLGGVEGFFDQNAALFADVAGLNSAEITSAFAPGVFDPTAFTAAVGGLFEFSDFNNLGADFTPIVSDFGAVFMSLF
jgi:hypothetical protein